MCLQSGHLNKTDHWPINIGKSNFIKNSSQKLKETDRGKSLVEVEESKKTDYNYGETRTESLVEKLGLGGETSYDVGNDMDLKNGVMEDGQDQVDKDLVNTNQYRGIGNMVGDYDDGDYKRKNIYYDD